MDAENTTSSPKLVIYGPKVNLSDTVLPKHRGAHDTGFYSHVYSTLFCNFRVNDRRRVKLLSIGPKISILGINFCPFFRVFNGFCCARIGGVGEQSAHGHVLCVSDTASGDISGIHSPGDHSAPVHEDTANRGLVCAECETGLCGKGKKRQRRWQKSKQCQQNPMAQKKKEKKEKEIEI